MSHIAFSCGDTNGIGPEICIKSIQKLSAKKGNKFILPIPANILEHYLSLLNFQRKYLVASDLTESIVKSNDIIFILLPNVKFEPGKPTKTSGKASIDSLTVCLEIVDKKYAEGIVTAPISKYAIKKAGINFIGHTELIAKRYNINTPVMTFISDKLKCALCTIHVPINQVSSLLTQKKVKDILEVTSKSLTLDFNKLDFKIGVLGLNPHAGENGEIGNEEINVISPIIKKNKNAFGPFVPDAYFGNKMFRNYDLTIGMYHDQVLIPFKYMAFDKGVNFTAGLPIVRTSPDHGTAYDIAGKLLANPNSMIEAYKWAKIIIKNRKNVSRKL